MKKNNEIAAINGTWGPFFRVSFDLIIHSHKKGKGKKGWSSILAFNNEISDCCNQQPIKRSCCNKGDNVPAITVTKKGVLIFTNSVNGNKNHKINFNIELNSWYNITIEQKPKKEKVNTVKYKFPITINYEYESGLLHCYN